MVNQIFVQKLRDRINRSLNKVSKAWNNPILDDDIRIAIIEIEKALNEETTIIQYDGIIRQRFLNHLAGDLAFTDQRRDWFVYRAIASIIATKEMTELLKKYYGSKYQELIQRFQQIGSIIEELKYNYDMMTQNPRDTKKYAYHDKEVTKRLIRLGLIQNELSQLLYIICTKTNLGSNTVPQQAISKISQEYKKTEIPEERQKNTTTTENPRGETQ